MVNDYSSVKYEERTKLAEKTPREISIKFIKQFARVCSATKGSQLTSYIVN